jgi:bacteriorhodopsin
MTELLRRTALCLILLMGPLALHAQDAVDMADTMRANGKLYVVVGVMAIIFIGLFIYLLIIDRKLSRMERGSKD